MIIDTSALLAVLNREPGADRFQDAILTAVPCRMSVANVLEALWQGQASSRPEFRRLLCVRAGPRHWRAFAVQGR